MTNLTIGDTVIAKHNNIWQKGHITNIYVNLAMIRHFYITFDDELTSSDGPYCRADIIKVDSNESYIFNGECEESSSSFYEEFPDGGGF